MKSDTGPAPDVFKKCPLCGYVWTNVQAFLDDGSVRLNGFQYMDHVVHNNDKEQTLLRVPLKGFFVFTHYSSDCGTSMMITASQLRSDIIKSEPELKNKRVA